MDKNQLRSIGPTPKTPARNTFVTIPVLNAEAVAAAAGLRPPKLPMHVTLVWSEGVQFTPTPSDVAFINQALPPSGARAMFCLFPIRFGTPGKLVWACDLRVTPELSDRARPYGWLSTARAHTERVFRTNGATWSERFPFRPHVSLTDPAASLAPLTIAVPGDYSDIQPVIAILGDAEFVIA